MLLLATVLLGVTAAVGTALAIAVARRAPWPRAVTLLHGGLALAGYGLLVAAVSGARRGAATGTASFGLVAIVLLSGAVLAGIALALLRRRKPGLFSMLVGVHATLAVSGFVILLAYLLLS